MTAQMYIHVCYVGDAGLVHVQVCKEDVDNYTSRRLLVPFQVMVRWVGDGDKPLKPLFCKIYFRGAKKRFDFLTVTSPKQCIGRFMQLWYYTCRCNV